MTLKIARRTDSIVVYAHTNSAPMFAEFFLELQPSTDAITVLPIDVADYEPKTKREAAFWLATQKYLEELISRNVKGVGLRNDGVSRSDYIQELFSKFLTTDPDSIAPFD